MQNYEKNTYYHGVLKPPDLAEKILESLCVVHTKTWVIKNYLKHALYSHCSINPTPANFNKESYATGLFLNLKF